MNSEGRNVVYQKRKKSQHVLKSWQTLVCFFGSQNYCIWLCCNFPVGSVYSVKSVTLLGHSASFLQGRPSLCLYVEHLAQFKCWCQIGTRGFQQVYRKIIEKLIDFKKLSPNSLFLNTMNYLKYSCDHTTDTCLNNKKWAVNQLQFLRKILQNSSFPSCGLWISSLCIIGKLIKMLMPRPIE